MTGINGYVVDVGEVVANKCGSNDHGFAGW